MRDLFDAVQRCAGTTLIALFTGVASAQTYPPAPAPWKMDLPSEVREWYRNPDGSCVQCSIGMCGVWCNVPAASTLLWDTPYGKAVRGGSWPDRVADYCERRQIKAFNITGDTTWEWMEWAARTGHRSQASACFSTARTRTIVPCRN